MHVMEGDFYRVELEGSFDAVFYWDGFGVGSDADQRRLLCRIAELWLRPGGLLVLDVYSPWNWARRDGECSTYTARDGVTWERQIEFQEEGSRFVDHWEPLPERDVHRSQTLRCYTLEEFGELVEGTGLVVDRLLGMDGSVLGGGGDAEREYLEGTNGFYALLGLG